jgi:hypothetical protein
VDLILYAATPKVMIREMTNQYHRLKQWNIKSLMGMMLLYFFFFLSTKLFAILIYVRSVLQM